MVSLRSFGLAALAMSFALSACTKQIKKQPLVPVATPAPSHEAKAEPVADASDANGAYVVQKGESLWKIAAKPAVMGDPFRWPLLYKTNRDQISDPDIIEVKQDLAFKKNYAATEVDEAMKKAGETPPYVPHAVPRKSLPVNY